MIENHIPPIHPGEVLEEEFLKPLSLSQYRFAHDIKVPPRRINEIVHGTRTLTADTALRLARYFGTSAQFWLNLQTQYDLAQTIEDRGEKIRQEIVVQAITKSRGMFKGIDTTILREKDRIF